MNDYVTHEELNHAVDKLSDKIDILGKDISRDMDVKFETVNTKFAEQKNWFYGTIISVVVATCAIMTFIIKFL
ncbi:hypothetical protein ACQW5G_00715 [Fructilactobacillus sp. Tb1]|uniref:hypothetical protein n=1 Tax=Fructilactobacillus sp. Tb1 TaxID=3422304 RepID=UPI003D2E97E6